MHCELEWPVSKATCSYRSLYTMYRNMYKIIEGTRISRSGWLKPQAARAHKHHDIVAHSVLNDNAHVSRTAELVVGNNNVALFPFARFLQAFDSLA